MYVEVLHPILAQQPNFNLLSQKHVLPPKRACATFKKLPNIAPLLQSHKTHLSRPNPAAFVWQNQQLQARSTKDSAFLSSELHVTTSVRLKSIVPFITGKFSFCHSHSQHRFPFFSSYPNDILRYLRTS